MKNIYATVSLEIVRTDLKTEDLGDLFTKWGLFTQAQEVVWVVTYDPMAQLRSVVEVARGNQYEVAVDLSAVSQAAWATGTNRIWLVHNHPSGVVTPTKKDLVLARQVSLALSGGNLFLEDCAVVGPPNQWWSMAEHGQYTPPAAIKKLYAAANGPIVVHREDR